jgi:hypothetical protein
MKIWINSLWLLPIIYCFIMVAYTVIEDAIYEATFYPWYLRSPTLKTTGFNRYITTTSAIFTEIFIRHSFLWLIRGSSERIFPIISGIVMFGITIFQWLARPMYWILFHRRSRVKQLFVLIISVINRWSGNAFYEPEPDYSDILFFVFIMCFLIPIIFVRVSENLSYNINSYYIQIPISVKEFFISDTCARIGDSMIQISGLENVDWGFLNRLKFVGVNTTLGAIYSNTRLYLQEIHKNRKNVFDEVVEKSQICYNAVSNSVFFPRDKMDLIRKNQEINKASGCGNFVRSVRITPDEKSDVSEPIAVAPIGCPLTNQGRMGPGYLPITDPVSILAAFCGRSMTHVEPENSKVDEFVEFAKKFYHKFIEETDVSGMDEEDEVEFFRDHYRTKRPLGWINGMIDSYRLYQQGLADKNYDSHSCFVKLENSSKRYGDEYNHKPRLIMTMSPVMLFETIQVHKMIERWNHGPFSRFQIKDLPPSEMIEKICDFQDRPHMVTDYSSFESSITNKIRGIENFVLLSLLDKAGFTKTKNSFSKYVSGSRILRTRGLTLNIETRCSGDPHTSCGNGIVNVAIAAWCFYKHLCEFHQRKLPFEEVAETIYSTPNLILAEGDDGLVSDGLLNPELVSQIGFDFSEAVCGLYPGDTDFLRRRWMDGKCYLNVGRAMSVFWVKNKANLSMNKCKFILRCMACSLHYMSPGHPILWAIVKRIGLETNGITKFKNWFLHIDLYRWFGVDVDNFPTDVECDESMRSAIEIGALGFPPISVGTQKYLEAQFLTSENLYIGDALNNYEEVEAFVETYFRCNSPDFPVIYSSTINELLQICGNPRMK